MVKPEITEVEFVDSIHVNYCKVVGTLCFRSPGLKIVQK